MILMRYREITEPKQLRDSIKANFEKVIKFNGRHEIAKLTSCQLDSYPSVTEWISAQDKIINDLAICDIRHPNGPGRLQSFGAQTSPSRPGNDFSALVRPGLRSTGLEALQVPTGDR